jgi:dTDP-4-dehydrorhamnose reductase
MSILVLGASGQLGKSIAYIHANRYTDIPVYFTDRNTVNIAQPNTLKNFLDAHRDIDICINAAAYTAVDKAEQEINIATQINTDAVAHIARLCAAQKVKLIHISTDFVFDGQKNTPYTETDPTFPLNIYGRTKRNGELAIMEETENYLIFRTSWLYSPFNQNFFNTITRLAKERTQLNVVYDQIGTPTYALHLAEAILYICQNKTSENGIFHYSNEGVCSWYDFAHQLVQLQQLSCKINPILSEQYPTPAHRPHYSVLNKNKIKETFNLVIPHWVQGLQECIDLRNTPGTT